MLDRTTQDQSPWDPPPGRFTAIKEDKDISVWARDNTQHSICTGDAAATPTPRPGWYVKDPPGTHPGRMGVKECLRIQNQQGLYPERTTCLLRDSVSHN